VPRPETTGPDGHPILVVFSLVYVGMILGEIPGLALDRTGVALLGAIVVVALENQPIARAWAAVDMPTLFLLFGMMVISAQFRLAGFSRARWRRAKRHRRRHGADIRRRDRLPHAPPHRRARHTGDARAGCGLPGALCSAVAAGT